MKKYGVGDYLMHESSGVCQVKAIQTMALQGKGSEKEYYALIPVYHGGSQIITPVDSTKARIRDVKSPEEIEALFTAIDDLEIIEEKSDRMRAERYKEHMAAFEPLELARIVKTVYERRLKRFAAGKKIMSQDEKALAAAGHKLFEEMAFSLDDDIKAVEKRFYEVLMAGVKAELREAEAKHKAKSGSLN